MPTRIRPALVALAFAAATFAGTAGTALMALAPLTINTGTFPVKAPETASAPMDISTVYAQGYVDFFIGIDTSAWTVADTITEIVEFSPDGGATWGWGPSCTGTGGMHIALPGRVSTPFISCGGSLPKSNDFSFTNAGWPAVQPARVLARVRIDAPSNHQSQAQITLD